VTLAPADVGTLTPLHHQVYVVLRQQLAENAYPPESPMPTENELARLFGVSRITVRRALDRLQAEGLVSRQRGRGTFAQPTLQRPVIQAGLRGIFENLVSMGLRTQVRLVEFGYVGATPEVAAALGVARGAPVQKAVRVRRYKGTCFSHLTTYLPEDLGRSFTEAELVGQPLLLLLERAGVVVSSADQAMSAKLADTIVAPLLEVEPGTALLWVRRTVRDQNARAVEYLEALYRPDVYEYDMTMARVDGAEGRLWAPRDRFSPFS
jgi:GntR family transcriptional regulator